MGEIFYKCIPRPNLGVPAHIHLPFYLHATGHFRLSARQEERVPPGEKKFVQLFWGVSGEGVFLLEGGKHGVMHPGDFFYRLPGEAHFQHALTPLWEYCWLTFDGPLAETFMCSYHYGRTPFRAGICPTELFDRAGDLLQEMNPEAWYESIALVADILARAGGRCNESTKDGIIADRILTICRARFQDPSLDVNTIAYELELDRSTVRRIFLRKMKMNPSEYLTGLRVQHALSLLRNTSLSVSDVAQLSGFSSFSYFCKIIRLRTGQRPSSFRRCPFQHFTGGREKILPEAEKIRSSGSV